MMNQKPKIGLALSGGGYRAAAFHLGTLKKLHELKILKDVDVISTISGGSIIGAYYVLNLSNFEDFYKKSINILSSKNVIKSVLRSYTFIRLAVALFMVISISIWTLFSSFPWLFPIILIALFWILIKHQFKVFPISEEIEKAYNKFFFNHLVLSDLPDRPLLAIGATNIQTCRPFTFSKRKMEDSFYAYMDQPILFKNENFSLAKAVMASSCVPFAFSPVLIEKDFFRIESDFERVNPMLVDGGVYDNQGIQKLTQKGSSYECDYIITSDAGNTLPFESSYNNTFLLLLRTVEVFMARIKNFQMAKNIYTLNDNKQIAYLSLGWDIENCIPGFIQNLKNKNIAQRIIQAHKVPSDWIEDIDNNHVAITNLLKQNVGYDEIAKSQLDSKSLQIARTVGTNLTTLTHRQIECLIKHSANITELQVRLYCPSLITAN